MALLPSPNNSQLTATPYNSLQMSVHSTTRDSRLFRPSRFSAQQNSIFRFRHREARSQNDRHRRTSNERRQDDDDGDDDSDGDEDDDEGDGGDDHDDGARVDRDVEINLHEI